MRRFLFENGLSLFFGVLCLGTLGAQSLAGQRAFNEEQQAHGAATVSWRRSRTWGSSRTRRRRSVRMLRATRRAGRRRAWRTTVYGNSLLLVMTTLFAGTWFAQSLTAWRVFNENQQEHGEAPVSWGSYVTASDFWERTLQNWQSEFLAVGTMAIFTVYLRQRGSPESKPVGAPHSETGTSG